jgi:hypothetical protein
MNGNKPFILLRIQIPSSESLGPDLGRDTRTVALSLIVVLMATHGPVPDTRSVAVPTDNLFDAMAAYLREPDASKVDPFSSKMSVHPLHVHS